MTCKIETEKAISDLSVKGARNYFPKLITNTNFN